MKNTLQKVTAMAIIVMAFTFSLSGCYETHYYHNYHHHSRGWYDRRHEPPPAGVNFELDVNTSHHRH